MKKVLAFILSLVYLVATNGVGMNLRYCCDKLTDVELSFVAASTPGATTCAMQPVYRGKNCCKDIHEQLKITQSQDLSHDVTIAPIHSFVFVVPRFSEIPRPYYTSIPNNQGNFSSHAPPLRETIPVYLKNCSFLI